MDFKDTTSYRDMIERASARQPAPPDPTELATARTLRDGGHRSAETVEAMRRLAKASAAEFPTLGQEPWVDLALRDAPTPLEAAKAALARATEDAAIAEREGYSSPADGARQWLEYEEHQRQVTADQQRRLREALGIER